MNLSSAILSKIGVPFSPRNQTTNGPLLKRSEVAALLNVSPLSVMVWERRGLLNAAATTPQGWSLFAWTDLQTVLREAISTGLFGGFRARTKRGPALGTSYGKRAMHSTST